MRWSKGSIRATAGLAVSCLPTVIWAQAPVPAVPGALPARTQSAQPSATTPVPAGKTIPAVTGGKAAPHAAIKKPATVAKTFIVAIEPAHGGKDAGASIASTGPARVAESEVTLATAQQLRLALAARSVDSRVGRAEEGAAMSEPEGSPVGGANAAIHIGLHATAVGSGVHVFYPLAQFAMATHGPLDQWLSQEPVPNHQSLQLAKLVAETLKEAQFPVTLEPAAEPVLSRQRGVAITIELAPLHGASTAVSPPSDPQYQQKISEALATALTRWRDESKSLEAGANAYARKVARP